MTGSIFLVWLRVVITMAQWHIMAIYNVSIIKTEAMLLCLTDVPTPTNHEVDIHWEILTELKWTECWSEMHIVPRAGASTTQVLVLPKMVNMNILNTLYSGTTRVLIFQYSYSYVQYYPSPDGATWTPGGCVNIKMVFYQNRNSHYKDETVWPLSHLCNGNPHIWKDRLYIETGPRWDHQHS